MAVEDLKRRVCETIDGLAPDLVACSREIHANPELAFQEFESARRLVELGGRADVDARLGVYGLETAFEAEFGTPSGPCVALLSEYDALPGIGHACGHNLIGTAALGAAAALRALGGELAGRVRWLGTPAEEKGGGKELMARAGAFENVDCALMIHPSGVDLVTMPCIAMAELDVAYTGVSAHASAMPERGINALDGLVLGYNAIAALRQHIRSTERIHGIITEGGVAANIVPDRAAGIFYVRARNAPELAELKTRVEACLRGSAQSTGSDVELRWSEADYLDLNTSWPLAEAYQRNAESLGRKFFPFEKLPPGVQGSTDMGNVSHRVPSIHPMIAAAPPHVTIHNPEFAKWAGSEMGDAALLDGAKALAMTALDFFADAELRKRTRDSFEASQVELAGWPA